MSSNSAAGLRAVCGAFVGLSVLTTAGRFYARSQSKAPYGPDDWLMVAATISFITASACLLRIVALGQLGYPSDHLTMLETLETMEPFQKLLIAWNTFVTLCLACTKISVLFFYRRIFCVHGRRETFYVLTTGTIGVVVCWLIAFEFSGWFQCGSHISALWDGSYLEYCTHSFPYLYGLAISDFLLDIWILVLPFPQILNLHVTTAKKASIGGVFLLAFVGLGASIARMVEYIQIENGGVGGIFSTDREESLTIAAYLAMLEVGMSLVAANLPSLWLIFTKTIPESVVRSIGSVLSLRSMGRKSADRRGSDPETGRIGGVSTEDVTKKSGSLTGTDATDATREKSFAK